MKACSHYWKVVAKVATEIALPYLIVQSFVLARAREFDDLTRDKWRSRSCPECLQGVGPPCRLHLLAGSGPTGRDQVAGAVQGLAERVEVFVRSMTWKGPTATPAERASWIEALGWFAGWDVAARLTEVAARR